MRPLLALTVFLVLFLLVHAWAFGQNRPQPRDTQARMILKKLYAQKRAMKRAAPQVRINWAYSHSSPRNHYRYGIEWWTGDWYINGTTITTKTFLGIPKNVPVRFKRKGDLHWMTDR